MSFFEIKRFSSRSNYMYLGKKIIAQNVFLFVFCRVTMSTKRKKKAESLQGQPAPKRMKAVEDDEWNRIMSNYRAHIHELKGTVLMSWWQMLMVKTFLQDFCLQIQPQCYRQ